MSRKPRSSPLIHLAAMLACGLASARPPSPSSPPPPLEELVSLRPSAFKQADRVPLAARHPVDGALPVGLAGREIPVREVGGDLKVDLQGDGSFSRRVTRRRPSVVEVRSEGAVSPLLVYWSRGSWFAASASSLIGEVFDHPIRLIDGDLDGAFLGEADYVQLGAGVPMACGAAREILIDEDHFVLGMDTSWRRPRLSVERAARPEGATEDQWRALIAVNRFRQSVGLAPERLDLRRSAACQLHAEYLFVNAYDFSAPWDGVGSHDEVEGKPGFTEEGREAARRSVIGGVGDPAGHVRSMSATMLHRIPFLGPPGAGLGVGAVDRTRTKGSSGYSVIWAGSSSGASAASPVLVPAPGQVGVELLCESEQPAPESHPDYYGMPRGYPVSVTLGQRPLADPRLELFRIQGKKKEAPVRGLLFSPELPIHPTRPQNARTVFFMPEEPLRPRTVYVAVFQGKDGDEPIRLTWSFTTGAGR